MTGHADKERRLTPAQLITTVRGVLSAVRNGIGPVAVVVNNNQPGTQHIVETATNVTLDVGTALYCAPLPSQATPIPMEKIKAMRDALRFYGGNGHHIWVTFEPVERAKVLARMKDESGWEEQQEDDRGHEQFVENGARASAALHLLTHEEETAINGPNCDSCGNPMSDREFCPASPNGMPCRHITRGPTVDPSMALYSDDQIKEETYDKRAFDDGRDNMADDILDILRQYEELGRGEDWLLTQVRQACVDQLKGD